MKEELNTTLKDIYLAAGAEESTDGKSVVLGEPMKPFKIELTVLPQNVEFSYGREAEVTFLALVDNEFTITDSGRVIVNEHGPTLTVPVRQVKIVEENSDD